LTSKRRGVLKKPIRGRGYPSFPSSTVIHPPPPRVQYPVYNTWVNGPDHRKSIHDEAVKENRTVEKVGSSTGMRRKVATIGDKSRPDRRDSSRQARKSSPIFANMRDATLELRGLCNFCTPTAPGEGKS